MKFNVLLCSEIDSGGLSEVVKRQYELLEEFYPGCNLILTLNSKKYIGFNSRKVTLYDLFILKSNFIVSHGIPADMFGLLFKIFGHNVFAQVHGYYPFHFNYDVNGTIKKNLLKFFSRIILLYSNLIFLDYFMFKFYKNVSNKNKVVISNFYSKNFVSDGSKLNNEILNSILNLKSLNCKIVVTVCGTNERKGHSELVLLAEKFPNIHFFNFGSFNENLKVYFDNLHYFGHITNWLKYLEMCDCFIHLSRNEGSPLAVIKALATNKPIFLSPIYAHFSFFKYPGVFLLRKFGSINFVDKYNRNLDFSDSEFLGFVNSNLK